jgi:hypothetical protein
MRPTPILKERTWKSEVSTGWDFRTRRGDEEEGEVGREEYLNR